MTCDLTTKASRGSALMPPQAVPAGTVRPCPSTAQRRCPVKKQAVCDGHSRSLTGRDELRRGDRRCSACKGVHSGPAWLGLGGAVRT